MTPTFLHIFTYPLRSSPHLLWIVTHSWWFAGFVCDGGWGGGWGGGGVGRNNVPCTCNLQPYFMLRYEIFSCTCTHVSCYAMRSSSLALALRTRDPKGRRVAKHLFDTVKSFMFRHNCGCQLWSQLGKLAKENLWNQFFADDLQNKWENTVKIEKRVCRLAPAMRISNRNLDTRDKNAVNTTICLQNRWKKVRFPWDRKPRRSLVFGMPRNMLWGEVIYTIGRNQIGVHMIVSPCTVNIRGACFSSQINL